MSTAVFLTTVPDGRMGRRIAKGLIRKRLAACVNVIDRAKSFYRWKGCVESSTESILIIKTAQRKLNQIDRYLKAEHPYELPELIGLPVRNGSEGYLQWVARSVT